MISQPLPCRILFLRGNQSAKANQVAASVRRNAAKRVEEAKAGQSRVASDRRWDFSSEGPTIHYTGQYTADYF